MLPLFFLVRRLSSPGKLLLLTINPNQIAYVITDSLRGKLYGIFSARYLYLISVLLFEVGSAICGAAPTMNSMIVGRAIAGLGVGSKFILTKIQS